MLSITELGELEYKINDLNHLDKLALPEVTMYSDHELVVSALSSHSLKLDLTKPNIRSQFNVDPIGIYNKFLIAILLSEWARVLLTQISTQKRIPTAKSVFISNITTTIQGEQAELTGYVDLTNFGEKFSFRLFTTIKDWSTVDPEKIGDVLFKLEMWSVAHSNNGYPNWGLTQPLKELGMSTFVKIYNRLWTEYYA